MNRIESIVKKYREVCIEDRDLGKKPESDVEKVSRLSAEELDSIVGGQASVGVEIKDIEDVELIRKF